MARQKSIENSLIKAFLVDKELIKENDEIYKIDLPRKMSMFMRSTDNKIYELLQFNEKHRCFFIDSTVCSNGKFYLTTIFDPLFAFIQYIEENCKTKAQPLDQILTGNAHIFLDCLKMDQMKMVADQKGTEDLKAFKYNEEKVIKWLKIKFKRITESLKRQNIIKSGSSSMNFVQSSLDNNVDNQEEIEATALGIISEYISLDLYEKLDKIYGISEKTKEPISQKRKSTANENEPTGKKIKPDEVEDVLKESNVVKPAKTVTKNAAKLEKAAKGTKSISSFFAKK